MNHEDERRRKGSKMVQVPGTLLYSYQVPQGSVYSFSWMENRPRLAITDAYGKIKAWDFVTGSLFSQKTEGQNTHISWSPNGQQLACFVWYKDKVTAKLQLWNAETGSCLATYAKAWEPLIWSPDGTFIAFRGYEYNPQDNYGQHFNQDDFNFEYWMDTSYENQTFQIWTVDQSQLISTLSKFRGSTGELIPIEYADRYRYSIWQKPRPVWSPDGKYIAFSPQADPGYRWIIPVYEVATGNFAAAYPLQQNPAPPLKQKAMWGLKKGKIAWSPDATHIACWASYFYNGIIVHDDGLRQNMAWHSQEAQIWTIATQSEITPRSRISTLAWSPDSTRVAFPFRKEIAKNMWIPTVEIWDVATRRELLEVYKGHVEEIVALAWSPDNKRIASASSDGQIHIWDVTSAKCTLIIEFHSNFNRRAPQLNMEWSPDGTQLASISPDDRLLEVWQVV